MAAEATSPQPNWLVLDACAAPGNKSTHLASILLSKGSTIRPCVLAIDRDEKRFQILKDKVKTAGAEDLVQCTRTDFLSIDPAKKPFCDVKAIVLDPSCSGSGLRNRVSVSESSNREHMKRLGKLAHVQKLLLKHALSFPNVVVVSYSTCSIHKEENEMVVASVLGDDVVVSGSWGLSRALPQWKKRGMDHTFDESQMCIRTNPELDNTNGFFLARFERAEPTPGHVHAISEELQSASAKQPEPNMVTKQPTHAKARNGRKRRPKSWKRGIRP